MAINIDGKKLELIERFLGLVIRQVPNLAAAALSIKNLLKSDEITDAELDAAFASMEAAFAELQAAVDKRLAS